jgi:cytochrome c-type biogenesis protein CcsB
MTGLPGLWEELLDNVMLIDTGLHWTAVIIYVIATVVNAYGLIFGAEKIEKVAYLSAGFGLLVHGIALLYRWRMAGHGPYLVQYEVLSANAWIMMAFFLLFLKFFPRIRAASFIVFPSTFLLIALSVFSNPEISRMPPSVKSVWLILHVAFYKISLATNLIGLALSFFTILKTRNTTAWLSRVPDAETTDMYAYRFAGFGFVFWTIGMLAGSIWAYQLWARFWAWDPIETWSLITWAAFGLYLHLRRFFAWKGEKAAYFFILCFILSIVALFFIPLIESSVHSVYFS